MYKKVKVKSITSVGGAFKIEDYNGNSDLFPKSTIYDNGVDVFIKCWILDKKTITYSSKDKYYLKNGRMNKFAVYDEEIITPKKVVFNPNELPNESLIK